MSNTCGNPECVGERIALKVISETLRETRKPPHDCAATLHARLRDPALVEEMAGVVVKAVFEAAYPVQRAQGSKRVYEVELGDLADDWAVSVARAALAVVEEMLKEARHAD